LLHVTQISTLSRKDLEAAARATVNAVPVGNNVLLARVLGSLKMYMHGDDVGFAGNVLLDGYWESWVTRYLATITQPGMTAIDVGANYGYYSLLMGQLVQPTGKIFSIEPNPVILPLLRQSLSLMGLYHEDRLIAAGASDKADPRAYMAASRAEPKNGRFVHEQEHLPPGWTKSEVPVVVLDEVLQDEDRIDVIKIDAEGAEPKILAGLQKTLSRHKPHLVLEFNASRYNDPREVLAPLTDLYGAVAEVTFQGNAEPADPGEICSDVSGEDRILAFSPSTKKATSGDAKP